MQHTITASTNTFLKKRPVQSSQLKESEKVAVPAGKIYPVEEYKPAEDSVYGNVSGYIVEPVQQLDNNHVVDYRANRLFSG
jgi:hypothetical protein